jgi:hypothetical protein
MKKVFSRNRDGHIRTDTKGERNVSMEHLAQEDQMRPLVVQLSQVSDEQQRESEGGG